MRKRLRELRKSAGLSQRELADRIRCTRVNYAMIESGKSDGSMKIWLAIKDALGVSAEEILYIIAEE